MPGGFASAGNGINLPAVLIANGIGLCLTLIIQFNRHQRVKSATMDEKIFSLMCRICGVLCVTETVSFLLDGRQFPGAEALLRVSNAMLFALCVLFSFFWVLYVDYKLFEDRERLRRYYPLVAIPAAVVVGLCLVNLGTDVFFGLTQENVYFRTPVVAVVYLVGYLYLFYGAVLALWYRRQVQKYLFMPVVLFLLPILAGSILQYLFYGLAFLWVSTALGLTSLHINLQNERFFLDPLTNLYSRAYLIRYLGALSERRKTKQVTGLMMDVNHFKLINDHYGHLEGDLVLREVGSLLQCASGSHAMVARYGGDEFVILLEDAQEEETEALCRRIEEGMEKLSREMGLPYRVSLSIGVAWLTDKSVDSFLWEMDRRMYENKRAFYSAETQKKEG